MSQIRRVKLAAIQAIKTIGGFERLANSRWRQKRLLILCYHGISLEDEHLWRPTLYVSADMLENRLRAIKAMECSVLPLGEALNLLRTGDLPPRSVVITFDDGTYDFYKQAWPRLQRYNFPATVYQTTYYSDREMPIFNLICSYMLWKRRETPLEPVREFGIHEPRDLSTEEGRIQVVTGLVALSERDRLSGQQKNELARRLADALGIDFSSLSSKRVLHLMNAREVAEVGRVSVDVQLHGHRHRTPRDEMSFRQEIRENRERIQALTGRDANHFCYPSGAYRQEFVGWLQKEHVVSATTCDPGLVQINDELFRLPRFLDTSLRTQVEFDSWLSGAAALMAMRRSVSPRYIRE